MLIFDRVFCDCCRLYVGQIFSVSAIASDLITNQWVAPYFVVCPDCRLIADRVD